MCLMRSLCALMLLVWTIPLFATTGNGPLLPDEKLDSIISGGIAVVVSVIVSCWTVSRKQFADTITKERLNFIKEWRECTTYFCLKLKGANKSVPDEKTLDYYYYKLLLMCNPTKPDAYMDKEVVEMLTHLYKNKINLEEKEIENFIALMQANISLEWIGTSSESRKGTLSDNEKESIRLKCYKDYKEYVKSK